jgi:hypothetical protein
MKKLITIIVLMTLLVATGVAAFLCVSDPEGRGVKWFPYFIGGSVIELLGILGAALWL